MNIANLKTLYYPIAVEDRLMNGYSLKVEVDKKMFPPVGSKCIECLHTEYFSYVGSISALDSNLTPESWHPKWFV